MWGEEVQCDDERPCFAGYSELLTLFFELDKGEEGERKLTCKKYGVQRKQELHWIACNSEFHG